MILTAPLWPRSHRVGSPCVWLSPKAKTAPSRRFGRETARFLSKKLRPSTFCLVGGPDALRLRTLYFNSFVSSFFFLLVGDADDPEEATAARRGVPKASIFFFFLFVFESRSRFQYIRFGRRISVLESPTDSARVRLSHGSSSSHVGQTGATATRGRVSRRAPQTRPDLHQASSRGVAI